MSKRLSQHICALLMEHHCVIVPGLGGFVLESLPAHWDEASQLAYPPGVELHFQEVLNHQDGLIESAYARHLGISMRRARVMVEEEIRLIRNQLLSHRNVEMEGLGTLELTLEGKIMFYPQLSDIMQCNAYGLSPASLPSVSDTTGYISEGLSIGSDERGAHNNDGSAYIHLRLSKRMLATAASVAVFALALLPWGKSLERGDVATASFAPPSEMSSAPQQPSNRRVGLEDMNPTANGATMQMTKANDNNSGKQPPSTADNDLHGIKIVEPIQGRYYIIIASEPSMQRIADHYRTAQEEMSEMQYPDLCVLPSMKMHKVSAASFETQAEAYTYLRQLSKKHKSAWVLKG